MTVPLPSQTVHLMTRLDVRRVLRDMRRSEGRNVRELELYTTDDLRHLYQTKGNDLIRLRDGLVSRAQLVAEILRRGRRDRTGVSSAVGSDRDRPGRGGHRRRRGMALGQEIAYRPARLRRCAARTAACWGRPPSVCRPGICERRQTEACPPRRSESRTSSEMPRLPAWRRQLHSSGPPSAPAPAPEPGQ